MTSPNTEAPDKKKQSILNILAIFGFLATVLLVAWLSLLLVQILPTAFNSLASIADSLYNPSQNNLVINNTTPEVYSGETVDLTFAEQPGGGTYTFSYSCHDGVSLTLLDDDTNQPLRCDMVYSIGTRAGTTFTVTSDTASSVLITYNIAYLRTNDSKPRLEGTGNLVITNPDIANNQPPVSSETVVEVTIGNDDKPEVPAKAMTTPEATPVPARHPIQTAQPAQRFEVFSYIPPSQTNGFTDLQVAFVEMGYVRDGNLKVSDTFTRNSQNFLRFEIKNIGTKTSERFSFTTRLPDNNVTVHDNQIPLKPNERAVITVRFPAPQTGTALARVSVEARGDQVSINDTLLWSTVVR